MLYELREYYTEPGLMYKLHARFRNHTLAIWERLGIEVVGFWEELVGNNQRLTYIIRFEDMADREARWGAFISDPEWQRVKAATEADGQFVSWVENRLMRPTDYSPLP